jgi:hypothetical protein
MDKRLEFIGNLVVLALGVCLLYQSYQLGHIAWGDSIGPAGFPKALGFLLIIMSLLLMFKQILKWRRIPGWKVEHEGEEDEPGFPVSLSRVIIIIILSFAYSFTFETLGFLIGTPLYLLTSLYVLGIRKVKQLVSVPIGFTVSCFIVFVVLARVRFPMGPLEVITDLLTKLYSG